MLQQCREMRNVLVSLVNYRCTHLNKANCIMCYRLSDKHHSSQCGGIIHYIDFYGLHQSSSRSQPCHAIL